MCVNAAAAPAPHPSAHQQRDRVGTGRAYASSDDRRPIAAAIIRKELPAMESGAMCYMMSKQGYGGDSAPHWPSHLMFFYTDTDQCNLGSESARLPPSSVRSHPVEHLTRSSRWSCNGGQTERTFAPPSPTIDHTGTTTGKQGGMDEIHLFGIPRTRQVRKTCPRASATPCWTSVLATTTNYGRTDIWSPEEPLQPPNTAVTVYWKNGKVAVTDGPYAETKEQLGGIQVLEARDLNHAIQLISQSPGVKLKCGTIEIRPAADISEIMRESEQRRRNG